MNKTDNKQTSHISIRNANIADLTAILNIEKLGFTAEEAGTKLQYIERLKKLKETFLVGVVNNQVVGFIVGPVVQEDRIADWMYEEIREQDIVGGNQMVLTIAVDPTFQGFHIGSQLLDAFYNKAKTQNSKTIALTCLEKNIAFYEKNGYKNMGQSLSNHAGEIWYDLIKKVR
ncbi:MULTISPECIES: GNAT family N-acetyltransferase [Leuconostoc]|uniref:Acetyltransferase (Putative) n=2 Tax=Leuconostoc kimchii TaxID=136609 RepID=D5T035_LEUKI|nr:MULTISPECIES: GNAT family N-acetyltransferase [Leuconostoc]ADG39634.1 acetyltransferase (putative) [Leuconostoc kimchii IMSNU 11154]AEJ30504.1 acetyltransferase (putative) [Leuconostoc sp. C2]QBR47561.1 GNAT family N-acetyltransferase [Leuconostoc kimchii]